MILFGRKKAIKNPKRLIGVLLREMYPVSVSTEMEKIGLFILELKNCIESFFPLSKYQLNSINEIIEERFIYHSCLVDNNSLNKSNVRAILRENKVVCGVSLSEHLEIVNQREALDFVKECLFNGEDLSRDVLLKAHYLLLKGIDTKNAGIFRDKEIDIFRSEHKPSKPEELEEQIYKYFQFYNSNKDDLDVITLATEIHGRLCFIKPFVRANGAIARLFMNYILMRDGFPIINIAGTREGRLKYFQALEDFPKNPKIFHRFITMCVFKSLVYYMKSIVPLISREKGKCFYEKVVRKCGVDNRDKLYSLIGN